jgi:glycosyltransferase involved in cell wall biosynthesis
MKRVLMIGPGKSVQGGISALVNNYFDSELVRAHRVSYLESHVEGPKWAKAAKFLQAGARFFRILFAEEIEIVHVHSASRASFFRKSFFLWAAKALGRRAVFHLHGGEFALFFHRECGPLKKRYIRNTLRRADVLIGLSASGRRLLAELTDDRSRIVVLHNGVRKPLRQKAHRDTDRPCVLYMGKLYRVKGVFDLIEAAAALKSEGKNLRIMLCGDGERRAVEEASAERDLADWVEMPGWVSDKAACYLEGDIFVLPSYSECLPMALIEAASYGLPLVSTSVGGVPDIVIDAQNGFLVAPGDVPALKARIAALAGSAQMRRDMGREGRRIAGERFSLDAAAARLAKIYEDL